MALQVTVERGSTWGVYRDPKTATLPHSVDPGVVPESVLPRCASSARSFPLSQSSLLPIIRDNEVHLLSLALVVKVSEER